MRNKIAKTLITAAIMLVSSATHASTISIGTDNNATNLINYLIGSGVTVVDGTPTFTGNPEAVGFFYHGFYSGLGTDSGIALSTGKIADAVGPNDNDSTSTNFRAIPGDSDLDSLLSGYSTEDAAVLEFDFLTSSETLFLNFIFASEAYNEKTNQNVHNDVIGIFIDGVNIALIPGTTTPVTVKNINNDVNSEYYNDNDPSDLHQPTPYNFEYDGFTTVLTTEAIDLDPLITHHIKIAIGDTNNGNIDSAIFLQRASFSDTPVAPLPEPSSMVLGAIALTGALGMRKKQVKST